MFRMLPLFLLIAPAALGQAPATQPAEGRLPHIQVDVQHKRVRVECQAVNADAPLEFVVCLAGTKEYESLLKTRAKPSHLHLGLLMAGLTPGKPVRFDEKQNKVLAPEGTALKLTCEFQFKGKTVAIPASRLMCNQKTREEMPDSSWVFAGSQLTEDGAYFADISGEIVSVVNFAHTVIDVPSLRSDKNESLEWVPNMALAPERNATVWLVIEPVEAAADARQR